MSHEQKLTLHVDINVPDHPDRTASATFRQTRHEMVNVEGQTCWICGTKDELELHHNLVEWCFMEGIDFSEGANIRKDRPDVDWSRFTPEMVIETAPAMLVLCKYHHTGEGGIHVLPYPIWKVQRYLKKDYQLFVQQPEEKKPLHKRIIHHVKNLISGKS